jgi:hypothetical protein
MYSHAKATLKRLRRPRYRLNKSTGKRVLIGGPQDTKTPEGRKAWREGADRRARLSRASLLDPANLTPRAQKARARAAAGKVKANARNSKRLTNINVARGARGLEPITDVDEFGVPVIGWERASAAMSSRLGTGGVDAIRANRGGYIRGYKHGGSVDNIPAYLSAGEFVMRKDSVKKYGERFMDDLNRGAVAQGFQLGGAVGAAPARGGGAKIVQSQDLERGAKLAGDSILNAFTQGSQMVGDAIRQALAPENLAAQIGDAVAQKMQESIAATSIDMKGNMGVDVRLTGDGATGDIANKMQGRIKEAIAEAFNDTQNIDGSAKDPSIHRTRLA